MFCVYDDEEGVRRMKKKRVAYPVLIKKGSEMYLARIPDLDRMTQGYDFADAMDMARDCIGLWAVQLQSEGKEMPKENTVPYTVEDDEVLTYVDIDFEEYKRKNDNRAVKKNCTIPSWLAYQAEQEGINFSQVLQEALKEKLGIEKE